MEADSRRVGVRFAARRLAATCNTAAIGPERTDEHAALVALLLGGRSSDDPLSEPLACAVAAACLEPGHLWKALDLPDRPTLRILLEEYFGELARANTMDMRWKKYFYKRLCGWEGFQH